MNKFLLKEWKSLDFVGDRYRYEISNYGEIKCLRDGRERIRKLSVNKQGYVYVVLKKHNIPKTYKVHKLVWKLFGDIQSNDCLVLDHIDGDKLNNRVDNLQLLTSADNIAKGWRLKKKSGLPRGVYNLRGKYTSHIKHQGKTYHLGVYNCITAAKLMYDAARIRVEKGNFNGRTD